MFILNTSKFRKRNASKSDERWLKSNIYMYYNKIIIYPDIYDIVIRICIFLLYTLGFIYIQFYVIHN